MLRKSIGLVSVLGVLVLAGVAVSQEARMKPVGDVTEIMQAMTIPASNALFNVPRQAPSTDEEWAAIRNHAILLGESGNLLMFGSRSKKDEVWMSSARLMVDAGDAALKAAKAKDAEAIGEIGNQIIESCETCHEAHWDRSAD